MAQAFQMCRARLTHCTETGLTCSKVEMLHCDPCRRLWKAAPSFSWSPAIFWWPWSLGHVLDDCEIRTHLALSDVHPLHTLRSQPFFNFERLETLHLTNCGPIPLCVRQAKALVQLQKLTAQDSTPLDAQGYPFNLLDNLDKIFMKKEAERVMEVVLVLPHIRAISGECALLKLGMSDGFLR